MELRYGYKPHTVHEYEQLTNEIRKEMARRGLPAAKDEIPQTNSLTGS